MTNAFSFFMGISEWLDLKENKFKVLRPLWVGEGKKSAASSALVTKSSAASSSRANARTKMDVIKAKTTVRKHIVATIPSKKAKKRPSDLNASLGNLGPPAPDAQLIP
jgi:hypothetical protein